MMLKDDKTTQPQIMGVLNVTPDSFSDGGRFNCVDVAVEHAIQLLEEGADYIDIGGESTRPGAAKVSVNEEMDRVLPVVEAILKARPHTKISVDTSTPELMHASLECGALMINDVRALQREGALDVLAKFPHAKVCLMHMQGVPESMQDRPHYEHVVFEVADFLRGRVTALESVGIPRDQIWVDPGIGFGKKQSDNVALMKQLGSLRVKGCGQLAGVSRKSMIGYLTGHENPAERLYGSLGAVAAMALQGVNILRVHDVQATRDCLSVFQACLPTE